MSVLSADALAGCRILVIGGGGEGNGRAIVRAVAASGAAGIAIVDVDPSRAAEAAQELEGGGRRVVGLPVDVRSGEQIDAMVRDAVQAMGGLDVVITVVGGYGAFAPWEPLHETDPERWERVTDLNLTYVYRTLRAAIPVFLEQGTGGTVVSVGSIAGHMGSPMSAAYGAAKAGLASLARTVSVEYGRRGIRMNVLSCGPIATPAAALSIGPEMMEPVPAGRFGTPDEVADAVVFLASPGSAYVAGQDLAIDGATSQRFPLALPQTDRSMAG